MRRIAAMAAFVAFAFVVPGVAKAHYLPKPRQPTPTQRVSYLERSVQHDRTALAWISRALQIDKTISPYLAREKRWHRTALRWQLQALALARTKVTVYTGDWITATGIVGHYYGAGVASWLVDCSSSEGGHGSFVWYGHGSGGSNVPGGWMQFMDSTFWSNVGWAWEDARQRGLRASPRAKSYTEPLGQAITAGAMYAKHGNPGTWTGALC